MSKGTKQQRRRLIGVIDFFSGCGGTSLGFRQAGMRILAGVDNDPDAAATFRDNFPEGEFFEEPIEQVSDGSIRRILRKARPKHVLFCGCAPCQPFSKIRRGSDTDSRSDLLDAFGAKVKTFRPALVFIENVPGLQDVSGGEGPLQRFCGLLEDINYAYSLRVVCSQDYGVPQRRRRLVLIASSLGVPLFPDATHGPGRSTGGYSPIWDWIGHLPPIEAGEEHSAIPNHRAARLSDQNLKRIRATPQGGGRGDWPSRLVLDCHRDGYGGHTDVYGRMHKDRPASALTTRCISLSNGRFGHPEQDRAISVREAAAIQTFPDNFVLHGSFVSTARQVGNAVPVLLARRFGEALIKHVKKFERGKH